MLGNRSRKSDISSDTPHLDTPGPAYYRRKRAAGKTTLEALRCLKRRISDALYRQLVADARQAADANALAAVETGPGGHCGATQESSATDLLPLVGTSDQPLPGPANLTLQASTPVRKSSRRKTPQTTG